jgi:hypothetical protein
MAAAIETLVGARLGASRLVRSSRQVKMTLCAEMTATTKTTKLTPRRQ